jgi:hypothetical protein
VESEASAKTAVPARTASGMNMLGIFGIGPQELLILAVIGLMLLAPIVLMVVLVVLGLRRRDAASTPPCPDCNRPVSPVATSCPHCGHALR